MNTYAVIGAGFGDEGKGKVVSYLCSQHPDSIVVRFSGGQQAGHRVYLRHDREHIFSNYGSGTLQGIPTYWMDFCTIDPEGIVNERMVLNSKRIFTPRLYIDGRCPVTTPYEKNFSMHIDNMTKHGSCGVGVGHTYEREEKHYSILAEDLLHPSVLRMKLSLLPMLYGFTLEPDVLDSFLSACDTLIGWSGVTFEIVGNMYDILHNYGKIIFEGSQGLLLDQNFGFFPHVARGNFGMKNILMKGFQPHVFLVTRAYQTRHGNGPMTNEHTTIPDNSYEHNEHNFQGPFRKTVLDLDLLKYAISKDPYIRGLEQKNKTLVITCLDVIGEGKYCFTRKGVMYQFACEADFVNEVKLSLDFEKVLVSKSPMPDMAERQVSYG